MASTLKLTPNGTGMHRVVLNFDETGSLQSVNIAYHAEVADRADFSKERGVTVAGADVPAAAKSALETMFKNKVTADSGITFS